MALTHTLFFTHTHTHTHNDSIKEERKEEHKNGRYNYGKLYFVGLRKLFTETD